MQSNVTKKTRSQTNDCESRHASPFDVEGLKRGDIVKWTGEQDGFEGEVREIVFACMVFEHRKQQRRYLVTFEPALCNFSLNSWSSWKLVRVKSTGTKHAFVPDHIT